MKFPHFSPYFFRTSAVVSDTFLHSLRSGTSGENPCSGQCSRRHTCLTHLLRFQLSSSSAESCVILSRRKTRISQWLYLLVYSLDFWLVLRCMLRFLYYPCFFLWQYTSIFGRKVTYHYQYLCAVSFFLYLFSFLPSIRVSACWNFNLFGFSITFLSKTTWDGSKLNKRFLRTSILEMF